VQFLNDEDELVQQETILEIIDSPMNTSNEVKRLLGINQTHVELRGLGSSSEY